MAIDQLRVALSRPTERLFWLDVNPTDQIVRQSLAFLNGRDTESGVSSCVPQALLTSLQEDELDTEQRVQKCQADARQYLDIKADMAWSRAQQAITLLGRPGSLAAVTDKAARDAAYLTLTEVCFRLGLRNARLAPELGRPDLFDEALQAADSAGRFGLTNILGILGNIHRSVRESRLRWLVDLAEVLPKHVSEIEPWLRLELDAKAKGWVEELEAVMFDGHNASIFIKMMPPFYEAIGVPDRAARTARLHQRAVNLLMKDKQFSAALEALRALPERQVKLEAICFEGMGDFRSAAELHQTVGNLKEALNCYRSIPDLESALKLTGEIGEHPAAESLQWIAKLQQFVAERPEKFTKVVTPAEKKLLETVLERALGVSRPKRAPRKAIKKATKAATPGKRVQKKRVIDDTPYF